MVKRESLDSSDNQQMAVNPFLITSASILIWAYLIACVFFAVAPGQQQNMQIWLAWEVLCSLFALTIVQFVLSKVFTFYDKEKFTLAIVLSFAFSLPLIVIFFLQSLGIQIEWYVLLVSWFSWGLSVGLFLPMLGSAWSLIDQTQQSRKNSPQLVSISFLGAAFLVTITFFLPELINTVLLTIYYFVAFGLFLSTIKHLPEIREKGSEPFLEKFDPSESSQKMFPLIICITASITLYFSIQSYGLLNSLSFCVIASTCGGILMFLGFRFMKLPIFTTNIERIYFPAASFCLLLLATLPTEAQFVPLIVLMTLFAVYAISHWSLLLALSHRYSFSSPYHFAMGLLMPGLGLLSGWALALLFYSSPPSFFDSRVLLFAIVVGYIFILSIAPYASDPTLEIDLLNPDITESMDEKQKGNWKKKCQSIADNANLSPREREVFELLARGRNAEYIQKKLYISRNTVNTHKYKIYRKLSIESHQEILDLIEQMPNEWE